MGRVITEVVSQCWSRRFCSLSLCFVVISLQAFSLPAENTEQPPNHAEGIRFAMLHFAPVLGDLEQNTQSIMRAMTSAKVAGVDWVLTPELALTGYKFPTEIGTDWITTGPDQYVEKLADHADRLDLVLFLSHLEKTAVGETFNTIFVVNRAGEIIGRHQKINTIPVAEDWSTPGRGHLSAIEVEGIKIGLLICADAWPQAHAKTLKEQGAELLVSSATWPPGEYGPGSSWLDRSRETGLPLFVNNRNGKEFDFDMSQAETVVVIGGEKTLSVVNPDPTLILFDWVPHANKILRQTLLPMPTLQ